ncbi:branched-chain amino acid ABC transporter permease/ATP-binding protein [Nocardia sp. NBC_00565]|uniref:branched-chain amino acid ABC transporter permease/ATP-binding protein n=1 Tax=Nocardia sp. NBC_00565 TaxID=2975993 RepID=UPI002E801FFB|nr:branched-chain amino acid ABC transporter permease/ATP-binding protein [Nocardia sp. NBC_00565]WUC04711.1 branched-chain amino acid ABC transporter permease/ATP-binding protein [Nocardia sp. NBC_00565]
MDQHLAFLALGLGNGAVYAALGLALVMTFRSSGVVNFSTGAVALYVAYNFAFLRRGELLVPIPGLPKSVSLGGPLGVLPACVISLAIAALLGAVLYVAIFRPLRNASTVAKAVASIGVMLVVQDVLAQRVGTNPISVKRIFPAHSIGFGGAHVPTDRIILAGVVIGIALLLALLYRFTRFGLATRAAASSEKGAILTGLSPDTIAIGNWALSTMVAGISGILIAPIVPLVPLSYTLFIVPALAAAFIGNFGSMTLAVGGGLLIGMLQAEGTHLQTTISWFPRAGMSEVVPLVLILAFLVFRGKPLPTRGAVVARSLGRSPRPERILSTTVIAAVIAVVALIATSGADRTALIVTFILAVIALSQVVVTGFAGQVSLAQLTLAGVSAFTLSRLGEDLGVPFPFAPILAALVAALVGVVFGLPALRVRGLPLTVATLTLAVFLDAFWFQSGAFTGGLTGAHIKPPTLFGLDLGIGAGQGYPRIGFGLLCLTVLVVVAVAVALLRRSRLGASMLAVRANERSAAAAGVDVARVKLAAFGIGAFIAGLGGALMAYQETLATSQSYSVFAGIGLFAVVYVAGITSVSGGILAGALGPGAIVFTLSAQYLHLGPYYVTISGILLVLIVIRYPEGIAGQFHRLLDRMRKPSGAVVPPADLVKPVSGQVAPAGQLGDLLFSATGLNVNYGSIVAVDDVSIRVRQGEILGLIGPNGAGKTTLIDAISGFTKAEGNVVLGDVRLDSMRPHHRSRLGLGRSFQGVELYDDLTVRENVEVGRGAARHRPAAARRGTDADALASLFGLLELDSVAERPVGTLSQGQRQLVSVARVLAGAPTLALLDEPAAGLDTGESLWLGERLRSVRDTGVAIMMVDHDMELVLQVCDRIIVLDLGAVIADGTPDEIRNDPRVVRAYLGTPHVSSKGCEENARM